MPRRKTVAEPETVVALEKVKRPVPKKPVQKARMTLDQLAQACHETHPMYWDPNITRYITDERELKKLQGTKEWFAQNSQPEHTVGPYIVRELGGLHGEASYGPRDTRVVFVKSVMVEMKR